MSEEEAGLVATSSQILADEVPTLSIQIKVPTKGFAQLQSQDNTV